MAPSVRAIKRWRGVGSGLVGLCLESVFLNGLLSSSKTCLTLGEAGPAGPAKPQMPENQNIEK